MNRILHDGRDMARIIQSAVDFDQGAFEATADFVIHAPDDWTITKTGAAQNRVPDSNAPGGWRSDFERPIRQWLRTPLRERGHALLVEGWLGSQRKTATVRPEMRLVQLPMGELFEDYLMVAAPVETDEPVELALRFAPPHWCLGALLFAEGLETRLPEHDRLIDRQTLSFLLENVVGLFGRKASYDGYLIWRRNEPES